MPVVIFFPSLDFEQKSSIMDGHVAKAMKDYFLKWNKFPIQKGDIFSMSKAAQGFLLRRTLRTPQTETRGEHGSSEKEPFWDGNFMPSFRSHLTSL